MFVGIIVSVGYIFYKKNKISDNIEYLFISIRSTFCFGCIIVFSFLWGNYFYRNNEYITIKLPVKSFFLDKSYRGGKFSNKTIIKSAFVIDYEGQTKNIIWDYRLNDTLMSNVKAIEIEKSEGFFGIDIIEETDLYY